MAGTPRGQTVGDRSGRRSSTMRLCPAGVRKHCRAGLCVEPGVLQALRRRGSPVGLQLQHGQQEVAELGGLVQGPLVLLQQHLEQTPRFQVGNVSQLTWGGGAEKRMERNGLNGAAGERPALTSPVEILPGVPARQREGQRNGTQQLDDVSDVI